MEYTFTRSDIVTDVRGRCLLLAKMLQNLVLFYHKSNYVKWHYRQQYIVQRPSYNFWGSLWLVYSLLKNSSTKVKKQLVKVFTIPGRWSFVLKYPWLIMRNIWYTCHSIILQIPIFYHHYNRLWFIRIFLFDYLKAFTEELLQWWIFSWIDECNHTYTMHL